ncbi:MAG: hypothetical protein H0W11_06755 [Gemmatimonadetes bacterium]|nr:hypothetical protein [Gemmatimonadota bacterium]
MRTGLPTADRLLAALLLAVALFCLPRAAPAQLADTTARAVGFAIPDAPALQFIGQTPARINRPISARALGTALLNGIDPEGRVQQGFAIDLAPWLAFANQIDLNAYQNDPVAFSLVNTSFSLGTARTAGDAPLTDLALGVRTVLFDRSDLMRSRGYTRAINDAQLGCIDVEPLEAAKACADTAVASVREAWRDSLWNEPSLSVAGATGWRLAGSVLEERQWLGFSTWGVLGLPLCLRRGAYAVLPFCDQGQVLFQAQYTRREAAGAEAANSLLYGARALLGSARVNAFIELLGSHTFSAPAEVDATFGEWSGGLEFRAAENMWLVTGFGSRFATAQAEEVAVIANLRWSIGSEPRFRLRP